MSSKLKAILAAMALLTVGFAGGVVATSSYGLHLVRQTLREPGDARPMNRLAERVHRRMVKELDLTPEQSQQVRDELQATAAQLRQVRSESLQRTRQIVREARPRLAFVLTSEQRVKFEKMADRRMRWLGEPPARKAPAADTKP